MSRSYSQKLKLYSTLAEIYDLMYQKIFDYNKTANFVDRIFRKYRVSNILEVGCGTGHLAALLTKKGYKVTGVDLYKEMLNIARKRNRDIEFVRTDMRNLSFENRFDAIVVLGRSLTYMTTNNDLEKAFESFNNSLKKDGLLLFDFFNAREIISNFHKYKKQKVKTEGKIITRISKTSWYLRHGVTWIWDAVYKVAEKGKVREYRDKSILRAFFEEELEDVLKQQNFKILNFYKKGNFILARKIANS